MPSLKMVGPKQTPLGMLYLIEGDIVSDTLAGGKHWDPHVFWALEPFLEPNETVIDVGANVGAHTLRFAERCPVIASEISPDMLGCLLRNMVDHPGIAVTGGIYSRPIHLMCREQPGNSASSLAWIPGNHGPLAKPFHTESKVCAIKVDAQGADLHCLMGLDRIILRDHPAIVFEFEADLSLLHEHTWDDYEKTLKHWGYGMERVKDSHCDWLCLWERGK